MLQEIDLTRIDLNLLVLFEAILREQHVGRAALRLHLSASAVSHGLSRLRRMLHDPLFLKHPKGVVATERANALEAPITEILQRVRGVISTAEGFDPSVARRRFTIAAPDAVFAVVLPPLVTTLLKEAPRIDLSVRAMLPHDAALAELDARRADLEIQPITDVPPRFVAARLYDEEFALAVRAGHPLTKRRANTLTSYCAASHVLVSETGALQGAVDIQLEKLGRTRRVVMAVPTFFFALTLVAESDLVAAVPRQSSATLARRMGLVLVEPPAPLCPLMRSPINLIATRAALGDAGVAWLFRTITECIPKAHRRR